MATISLENTQQNALQQVLTSSTMTVLIGQFISWFTYTEGNVSLISGNWESLPSKCQPLQPGLRTNSVSI